ncbi:MAG: DUF4854 domain-containing protein [Clostridiales bacterium]|nr:DUF4854 domain-containing protein [Clostridiales bacterium]
MKKRVAVLLLFLCGFGFAAGCAKEEKTVASYVEEHREIFSEMQASMAEGMTLEVSARGNSLAYVYQYTALTDAQEIQKLCSAMEKVWERQSESARIVLASLRAEVPAAESVIFEYLDGTGNIIFSREYKQ